MTSISILICTKLEETWVKDFFLTLIQWKYLIYLTKPIYIQKYENNLLSRSLQSMTLGFGTYKPLGPVHMRTLLAQKLGFGTYKPLGPVHMRTLLAQKLGFGTYKPLGPIHMRTLLARK